MKFILFVFLSLCSVFTFGQTNTLIDSIRTRTSGPFSITTHDSIQVNIKIDRLYWSNATKATFPETDLSFAIIDNKGKELLRKSYPYSYSSQIIISPAEFNIPGIGRTILIKIEDYPSCCDDGDGQIFGTNHLGYFVAMTGLIRLGRKYEDGKYFKPKYIKPENRNLIKSQPFEGSKLFLEQYQAGGGFQFLTIYNYNEFHPEGIISELYNSNKLNLDIIPFDFDSLAYQNHRVNEQNREPQEISLYTFTKTGQVISKPIIYKINSILKVMELKKYENSYWLHVRIDGIEGYIKSDDFDKMCFHAHS